MEVVQFIKKFCISPAVIAMVFFDWDDWASLDHKCVWVPMDCNNIVDLQKRNNVFANHIGAQGHLGSEE